MAESRLDQTLQPWMFQICSQKWQRLHRFPKIIVEISYGTVLPWRIFERGREVFIIDMPAYIRLEMILAFVEQSRTPAFLPVSQDSAVIGVIVVFTAGLSVAVLPDKLAGIFISRYNRIKEFACAVQIAMSTGCSKQTFTPAWKNATFSAVFKFGTIAIIGRRLVSRIRRINSIS